MIQTVVNKLEVVGLNRNLQTLGSDSGPVDWDLFEQMQLVVLAELESQLRFES